MAIEIPAFDGFGRTIMVQFRCYRCGKTEYEPLYDCLPSDHPISDLSDLSTPTKWRNGGFYYPTFCPDCAEKYDRFMKGE